LRDARLVIVATEGSDTEKKYFESFKFSNVQVKPIPSKNGNSSPEKVLENLRGFRSEYQIGEGDELWIAIDVDRWPQQALSEVAQQSNAASFNMAVSNPCFEFWLALHFEADLPEAVNAKSLNSYLRTQLGSYSKTKFDTDVLFSGVHLAIERARNLDARRGERWPNQFGSHCYKVVSSILAGAR